MMRFGTWLVVLASLLVGGNSFAQAPERFSERVITSETAPATCFDKTTQKLVGSMLVRSRVFVSPDRNYQAYAESEEVFRLVYLEEPSRYALLNNIRIVDWSPDNRHLLAELFVGQWGSDAGGNTPLLYDSTDGVFYSQKVVATALNIRFGHDCAFVLQTMGFAADGGVVLKIRPSLEEAEGTVEPDSCVKREGLWLLKDGVKPLTGTYRVPRYGRFLVSR